MCPIWLPSFHLLNKPGLGTEIDPGMALPPFPSSIGMIIRTHDLSTVSRVRYIQDRTFAHAFVELLTLALNDRPRRSMKSRWAAFSWPFQELGAFSLQWQPQDHSQTYIQPWLFLKKRNKGIK